MESSSMLTRVSVSSAFLGLLLFGLAGTTGFAQVGTTTVSTTTTSSTSTTTAEVVEWDTPTNADGQPGAITADLYGNSSGTIWFTTRTGVPRVYQFQPPANYKYGSAQETSWPLDQATLGTTGGLKRIRSSYDSRFIFVKTVLALQKIDTVNNVSTTYCDDAFPTAVQTCSAYSLVSDVAVDHNYFVYTTFNDGAGNGYLRRLDASANTCVPQQICPPVPVTVWALSSGGFTSTAGLCSGDTFGTSQPTDPCLSGVAVRPGKENLVYVAEPGNDTIAEVDTSVQPCSCSGQPTNVRRWNLAPLGVYQPRQINFDHDGILWIITGPDPTGQIPPSLVSLDPNSSIVTVYRIPAGDFQQTFGVAPDGGMIGYTSNDMDGAPSGDNLPEHKVGMLIPSGQGVYVCPNPYLAVPTSGQLIPYALNAPPLSNSVTTNMRQVQARIVPGNNGTFIEGFINRSADGNAQTSYYPLGIAPAFKKAVGTFLYAVADPNSPTTPISFNRVGFIRLPRKGFKAKHEREDKDCDDDGTGHDDQDHDGIPDQYKTSDSKSRMDRQNDSLAPGQTKDYTFSVSPNTLAIVAAIQSDNALEPVSVQVIDPNGITLATPVPTPGLAVATVVPTSVGNYTIRVTNAGSLPINPETQMIAREPLTLP
jgi:hypothetical protein